MKIERIGIDRKGLYSDVTKGNGEIFLSAQTGYDRAGTFVGEGNAGLQTEQACKNIAELLSEADADVHAICKICMYVPNPNDCKTVIEVVASKFKAAKPAMSCICVDLEEEKMLVKLDAEAYKE